MVILGAVLFYFIIISSVTFNCSNNKTCFNNKAVLCQPALYTYENQGNIFEYRILGREIDESCKIEIKLAKVSEASSLETKLLFENKAMKCTFPKKVLEISPIQETSGILNYCTGPLKEATLELMIKKLYGTIAQNLGGVLKQIYNNQTVNSLTNPSTPITDYTTTNGTLK